MRRITLLAFALVILCSAQAGAQWRFYYDGSVDPRCTPCSEGWQSCGLRWNNTNTDPADFGPTQTQYQIVANDTGGKALQWIMNPNATFPYTGVRRVEWQVFGGPGTGEIPAPAMCGTPAWLDVVPGTENGITMCFRFKVNSWTYTDSAGNTGLTPAMGRLLAMQRGQCFYNKLKSDGVSPFMGRHIFSLKYVGGDNPLRIRAESGGQDFGSAYDFNFNQWHEVWVRMVPDMASGKIQFTCYFDGNQTPSPFIYSPGSAANNLCFAAWKGGADTAVYEWDYFAITPGDYAPGALAIPAERTGASGTIGAVKSAAAEGGRVSVGRALVASIITDPFDPKATTFFAEDPDDKGVAGVKVMYHTGFPVDDGSGGEHTLAVGDLVSFEGGLCSRQCEATVRADKVVFFGVSLTSVGLGTVGTANRSVAGSYAAQLKGFQPPQVVTTPLSAASLRADGLLMTLWGTSSGVVSDGVSFYVDDGTGMSDGLESDLFNQPVKGIRCIPLSPLVAPGQGDYVSVVGCVGTYRKVDASALPPVDKVVPCIWVSEVKSQLPQ